MELRVVKQGVAQALKVCGVVRVPRVRRHQGADEFDVEIAVDRPGVVAQFVKKDPRVGRPGRTVVEPDGIVEPSWDVLTAITLRVRRMGKI